MSTDNQVKKCTRCLEIKSTDNFHKLKTNKNTGKIYYSSNCKPCVKIINKEIYSNTTKYVRNHIRPRGRTAIYEMRPEIIDQVKELLRENPRISNQKIAEKLNVCRLSIKNMFEKGIINISIQV